MRDDISLIGALDLGAGAVKCLIAREDTPTHILGMASRTRRWGPMGAPADPDLSQRLIRLCIEEAAAAAGGAPEAFIVALTPRDLQTAILRGETHLRRRGATARESEAAFVAAQEAFDDPDRRQLHIHALGYRADGGELCQEPYGLTGATLQAEAALVHCGEDLAAAAEAAIEGAGARVARLTAAPYAAGFAVLTAEEREDGALVLDMGEESIGLAWFQRGALVHAETVADSGAYLTQSLAAALNSNFAAAERVKRALSDLDDANDCIAAAALGDDGRLEAVDVRRTLVAELLERRLEELFELVRVRLDSAEAPQELGVALTGGASLTLGARAVAARVLERRVRAAPPAIMCGFPDGIVSPAFAAATGLLQSGLPSSHVSNAYGASAFSLSSPMLGRTVGRAVAWFKENF